MDRAHPDAIVEGGHTYLYRGNQWTTESGFCLSTTAGHELTLKFYVQHGRAPLSEPPVKPSRASSNSGAKTARSRAAVGTPRGTRQARGRARHP